MTAEEILAEAARLVEQGWHQGDYKNEWDGLCVLGALRTAAVGSTRWISGGEAQAYWDAYDALITEVQEGVTIWNDTSGRTVEEVATALRNSKRHL